MCGRFTLADTGSLSKRFSLVGTLPAFSENYNISPLSFVPVITKNSPNRARLMLWGYLPSWSKATRFRTINARSESLNKPFFRDSFINFRCLVPASGFYEWRKFLDHGREVKRPYFLTLKDSGLFAFGGIYSQLKDASGKLVRTFAIITTPPNTLVAKIHNRMPLIIPKDKEDIWLAAKNPAALSSMLSPFPARMMQAWRVGISVNNPANNNPALIEKYAENE